MMFRNQFRIAYSPDISSHVLSISHFALLQSNYFLLLVVTLTSTPKLSQMALQISEANYQWYQKLHSSRQNISSAIKVMWGKKSISEDEVEEDE
jgi:hypothetical protein